MVAINEARGVCVWERERERDRETERESERESERGERERKREREVCVRERERVRESSLSSGSSNSWCRGVVTFCLPAVRCGGEGGGDWAEGAASHRTGPGVPDKQMAVNRQRRTEWSRFLVFFLFLFDFLFILSLSASSAQGAVSMLT